MTIINENHAGKDCNMVEYLLYVVVENPSVVVAGNPLDQHVAFPHPLVSRL